MPCCEKVWGGRTETYWGNLLPDQVIDRPMSGLGVAAQPPLRA